MRPLDLTIPPSAVLLGLLPGRLMEGQAPDGAVVTLPVPPGMPVSVPASIPLAPGASQTSFSVTATSVSSLTVVPASAALGGVTASISTTVQPPPGSP